MSGMAAMTMSGDTAQTFLVHFFGAGLADDRYVVDLFRARADGDIVPASAKAPKAPKAKSGRKTARTTSHTEGSPGDAPRRV